MKSQFSGQSLNTIIFIALCAVSTVATAHTGISNSANTGFYGGFTHPLFGLDHLSAMMAVGVWSALTARRAGLDLLWGPLGFVSLLMVGAVLGLQGLDVWAIEPMIAASLLVIGLLVVARLRIAGSLGALMVGVFAIFHGLAHGHELAASPSAFNVLAGMLAATTLLHLVGLGLGWGMRGVNAWVARTAGAALAAFGSLLLLHLI